MDNIFTGADEILDFTIEYIHGPTCHFERSDSGLASVWSCRVARNPQRTMVGLLGVQYY
ncbi:MAG TPA: hypothetical protein VKA49_02195 [Flavitalea sp.]|nr:hypothetical protein [Flavitalea sp.]